MEKEGNMKRQEVGKYSNFQAKVNWVTCSFAINPQKIVIIPFIIIFCSRFTVFIYITTFLLDEQH